VIAVFDIDGVLADARHREHHVASAPKDWAAFFGAVAGDSLLEHGVALLRELAEEGEIVLLSGRPESTRRDTEEWLQRHGIAYSRLVLRGDRDFRPAAVLKAELIRQIAPPDDIAVVVDDDEDVVRRLAADGYRTRLMT
jgi:phosphoglycolate phosphatase-like HAD superfamily hydrolase